MHGMGAWPIAALQSETSAGKIAMNHLFAPNRGAAVMGAPFTDRKNAYPHLTCSWSLDPASCRLSCTWAPPESSRALAQLAWSPRLVPDDAILIDEPV